MMEKGSIVKVDGLQSDAGKKLNGAYGLIMGKASHDSETVTTRYPVLFFALIDGGVSKPILEHAPKNKVKAEHLTEVRADNEDALVLLRQSTVTRIQSAIELGQVFKDMFFLLEQCQTHFSRDLEVNFYYAKTLVGTKNFKRAAEVLKPLLPQVLSEEERFTVPVCCDDVMAMYCKFSGIFSSAGGMYFQDAYDCALKLYNANSKNYASQALEVLQTQCYNRLMDNIVDRDPTIAPLWIKASELYMKVHPNGDQQPDQVQRLASAHAFAGNHLEASKGYRKALYLLGGNPHIHQIYPPFEDNLKRCLVVSQLQCPGMPLEDVFVIDWTNNPAMCIKKSDAADCSMGISPGGLQTLMSVGRPPKIFHYPLPVDPNDPRVFPDWLLEQTKPDED